MPIRIFHNISLLSAQRFLESNTTKVRRSIQRVVNVNRINRGSDNTASLTISERLRSETRALKQALRDTNQGASLIELIEKAMNIQASILIRMRELSSQSVLGTMDDTERQTLQLKFWLNEF